MRLAAAFGIAAIVAVAPLPAPAAPLPEGFVRLKDVDPTIRQDMRYAGSLNFLGRPARGYEAPACILTRKAADALAKVQKGLVAGGLTLVVFDCYRPDRAVKDFSAWTKAGGPPSPRWHPKLRRERLIRDGYIASRSGHSRGSTIDLGVAPLTGGTAQAYRCGAIGTRTLDLGTGFDCLDPSSATASSAVGSAARKNRRLLLDAMTAGGFRNYSREWWHFTLAGESFPKTFFDFPVTEK